MKIPPATLFDLVLGVLIFAPPLVLSVALTLHFFETYPIMLISLFAFLLFQCRLRNCQVELSPEARSRVRTVVVSTAGFLGLLVISMAFNEVTEKALTILFIVSWFLALLWGVKDWPDAYCYTLARICFCILSVFLFLEIAASELALFRPEVLPIRMNHNVLASELFMLFFLSQRKAEPDRGTYLGLALLVTTCAWLGAGGIAAAGLGAVIVMIRWDRRGTVLAGALVALIGLITVFRGLTYPRSLTVRFDLWKYAFEEFMKSPFLGAGPGLTYPSVVGDSLQWHSHNLMLDILSTGGILGLLAILPAVYLLIRHALFLNGFLTMAIGGLALWSTVDNLFVWWGGMSGLGFLVSRSIIQEPRRAEAQKEHK